jgi:hypothetical protein
MARRRSERRRRAVRRRQWDRRSRELGGGNCGDRRGHTRRSRERRRWDLDDRRRAGCRSGRRDRCGIQDRGRREGAVGSRLTAKGCRRWCVLGCRSADRSRNRRPGFGDRLLCAESREVVGKIESGQQRRRQEREQDHQPQGVSRRRPAASKATDRGDRERQWHSAQRVPPEQVHGQQAERHLPRPSFLASCLASFRASS